MARAANQKLKCLYLWQFLLQNTDEEHPATIPQMIEYLARHDIPAERKSLYDDIEALRQCGLDVEYRKAQGGGYYVASREFQLPELKLLVDAVQSSKFLSLRKSNALITKLEKLASRYEAQALRRQVYVTHRVKNMNESIYYNVDALHSAIAAGSRITFRYFDWDITGKKKYRHEGKRYQISPWALLWDDENYYLVGYDTEHGERRHYRVDKMEAITQTGEERLGKELFSHFDPAEYSRKVFGMYGGEPQQITLQFAANMANIVFDRFGRDRILTPHPGRLHHHRGGGAQSAVLRLAHWPRHLGTGSLPSAGRPAVPGPPAVGPRAVRLTPSPALSSPAKNPGSVLGKSPQAAGSGRRPFRLRRNTRAPLVSAAPPPGLRPPPRSPHPI